MIATNTRLTICALWVFAGALAACGPASTPASLGVIALEHVSTSESGVVFRLINGSDRTLRVRGGHTLTWAIRTWPGDTGVDCVSGPPERLREEPIGIAEGDPGIVEVSPGEQVRLNIATTLPHQHVGGRCRLKLVLQDGTIVGPVEFRP